MLQYCNIKDEGLETIKSLFRETSSSVITLIVKPSGDKQRFVSFHILSNLCRCIAGEWLSLFVDLDKHTETSVDKYQPWLLSPGPWTEILALKDITQQNTPYIPQVVTSVRDL